MENILFNLSLLVLGMFVIRFGIIQLKKYKIKKIQIKNNLSGKIGFLIFFSTILVMIIYSIISLLK